MVSRLRWSAWHRLDQGIPTPLSSTDTRRRIKFSITLVPNCSFCLCSKVLTRAIQDDAFETSFKSIDDILDRPNMNGVNFVPLKWKEKMKNNVIFDISYEMIRALWHRVLEVAGARTRRRTYSLRVGAGARLMGELPIQTCPSPS